MPKYRWATKMVKYASFAHNKKTHLEVYGFPNRKIKVNHKRSSNRHWFDRTVISYPLENIDPSQKNILLHESIVKQEHFSVVFLHPVKYSRQTDVKAYGQGYTPSRKSMTPTRLNQPMPSLACIAWPIFTFPEENKINYNKYRST